MANIIRFGGGAGSVKSLQDNDDYQLDILVLANLYSNNFSADAVAWANRQDGHNVARALVGLAAV